MAAKRQHRVMCVNTKKVSEGGSATRPGYAAVFEAGLNSFIFSNQSGCMALTIGGSCRDSDARAWKAIIKPAAALLTRNGDGAERRSGSVRSRRR